MSQQPPPSVNAAAMSWASDSKMRGILACMVVAIILLNAGVMIFYPPASGVFDKLYQVLMLIIGYYFGRK
jgi:hypothetical protein